RHGLDASGLTDASAFAFRQDRRSRGRARFRGMQGLALLLSFLRDAGAAPPPAAAEPGDEAGVLVAGFAGYLAGERGLRPQTVVLAACARDWRAGRRDYAIVMLLARLGLRAGEAAAARIGDIDWRSGTILVRGKGGRDERLPLPADAGAAIADYCRNARPEAAASGMLFLHARAPYGPLSSSAVAHVVVRACRRAGLPPASA